MIQINLINNKTTFKYTLICNHWYNVIIIIDDILFDNFQLLNKIDIIKCFQLVIDDILFDNIQLLNKIDIKCFR